ncbi:MAG: PSD1 and planctomycete cytochrome C domain-containing protein [Planctomycetaceae bacterium]
MPLPRISVLRRLTLIALSVCLLAGVADGADLTSSSKLPEVIEFNRDIRPILSDRCFACHGPDKNKREAELRLDTREGLLGVDGHPGTVVPGKLDASELWRRVTSESPEERMPPAKFGKELSEQERALLRRWIEQGGKWEGHWAFQPITRPQPPPVEATKSAFRRNDVDNFILETLDQHQLSPSPEADRGVLLRRVTLDLTGLPPTTQELDAFLADKSTDAYEKVVDRLLATPQYGERMAMWWLDLVRYADSVGYHGDQTVNIWPFRDYVIKSFNSNKPFNQFSVEQLAGDLIPEATTEHRIASGYNRLGMMSAEGGVQPKEYLNKYIAERVRNLGGTWLGVTLGCCECHDHKYDPFTARDFYSLEAFFADIEERGLYSGANVDGNWGPRISLPTPDQAAAIAKLDSEIAPLQKEINTPTPELLSAQQAWEQQPPKDLPAEIQAILKIPEANRETAQKEKLAAHYRSIAPALETARNKLAELKKQRAELDAVIPTTLVTVSVAPRTVRVLPRGNWMDESHEPLLPAFPEILPHPAPREGRMTRLDLARWVTSPENPLTARVFVNRVWKLYFGEGLSRRLDDHGAQGDWPSHPQLLDWLAGRFIDSDWNVKQIVRLIVTSGTYRQSSKVTPELRERDPENRWLARQGRFRLQAEMVRDNALAVSGLLAGKVGGPSVKPYQPAGYWAYLNFPAREWQNGTGDELHRRGLYTHWQRQYLHPAMLAFDAPSREECAADRARSNTPLQSLVLMNDPEYVEAARAFAMRILEQGGGTASDRITWAFRRALARSPHVREVEILTRLVEKHLAQYRDDAKSADELLKIGVQPVPDGINRAELAAWTSVARTILNLHETVSRD